MDEYYCVPVHDIDTREHTNEHPFCSEMDCPCHEDSELIATLEGYRQDGLVSESDCDNIYHGRTI